MKLATGTVLILAGLLVVGTGIVLAITSNAETWIGPSIVGGGIVLLGLFVAWVGWAVRTRRIRGKVVQGITPVRQRSGMSLEQLDMLSVVASAS